MADAVQVLQSATFKRAYKRLHPNQKADVDDAVAEIVRDPTIGEAKKGDLAARRILISRLIGVELVKKMIDEIAPKFKDRNGGYTRIIKLPMRGADASPIAIIEFVS